MMDDRSRGHPYQCREVEPSKRMMGSGMMAGQSAGRRSDKDKLEAHGHSGEAAGQRGQIIPDDGCTDPRHGGSFPKFEARQSLTSAASGRRKGKCPEGSA
jgi:hypothetical protein